MVTGFIRNTNNDICKPNKAKQKASATECTGLKHIHIFAFTCRKFVVKLYTSAVNSSKMNSNKRIYICFSAV